MTSLASSFGLVFATIVASAHTSPTESDVMFKYGFWVSLSYGVFAFLAAIPLLWGIGVVSRRCARSRRSRVGAALGLLGRRSRGWDADVRPACSQQLGKTGETKRVEALVARHHEDEVLHKHAGEKEIV